jgi:ABC-type uncharacterized transport system ATPase subunit
MSDRIMVMRGGRIRGFLDREEATEEKIMALATGSDKPVALSAQTAKVSELLSDLKAGATRAGHDPASGDGPESSNKG